MTFLSLRNIDKAFGPTRVVEDFNLDIEQGEFVSFLGPSGCGKTTMLRIIAGFEEPTSGTVSIGGRDVTRLRPNQRKFGMVFQSYALFPNMTVAQNIGFGLRVAGAAAAEIAARVDEMLRLVHLEEFRDRYPYQLSGGQQQRVALARAMAVRPEVLLLDEPLSALDAKVRVALREEIRAIQRSLGITTIFVTHDQEEALSMSDRVVVMSKGRVEQVGTPFEIYNRPATRFVASFVGTLNLIDGVIADPETGTIEAGGNVLSLDRRLEQRRQGEPVSLALRPEAIILGAERRNVVEGTIDEVHFLGSVIRVKVSSGDNVLWIDMFNTPASPPPVAGDRARVSFHAEDLLLL